MFFSIHTLGCKLNQLESEAITDAFRRAGFTVLPWGGLLPPESDAVMVVNTCTVTSKAEQKGRRVIRNALRAYPHAALIVTGCYAQLDASAVAALADGAAARLFVLGGERKSALLDLAAFLAEQSAADVPASIARWMRGSVGLGAGGAGASAASGVSGAGLGAGSASAASGVSSVGLGAGGADAGAASGVSGAGLGAGGAGAASGVSSVGQGAGGAGASAASGAGLGAGVPDAFRFNPSAFSFHSRASLKIQDGCDHRCAYCRVCLARGKSVSLEPAQALASLRAL
ncbi:MAG: hypothetical protein LBS86_03195, partial [Treponema sp.]|nr:hypothetical protein [Treponema sp.]